ncbi:MAG: hypothetical protein AAGB26_06395 [Planctomycetota bacterium]
MPVSEETKIGLILVAIKQASDIRRPLAYLRAQNNVEEIELLLVAEHASVFDDLLPHETAGFGLVQTLSWGEPISNVDLAAAIAIRAAKSPVTAIIEDHVYLEPDWAQIITESFAANPEIIGVGSAIELANQSAALPWANHLFALSKYTPPVKSGLVPRVSRHHIAYRTSWLVQHDHELEGLLPRGGGIIELAAKEGGLYMAADARLYHLTTSVWGPSLRIRVASGRASGSQPRLRSSLLRKLVASIQTPRLFYWRIRPQLSKYHRFHLRALPIFLVSLLLMAVECFGYLLGIWAGPGDSEAVIAGHEAQREKDVCEADIRYIDHHWPASGDGSPPPKPIETTTTEAA